MSAVWWHHAHMLRERSVYAEALGLKEGASGRTSLFDTITGRQHAVSRASAGDSEAPPPLNPREVDQSRD